MYKINGQEIEIAGRTTDNKYIVRAVYESYEDSYLGDIEIIDTVFEEPPTEKRHHLIKQLEEQESALKLRIKELKAGISEYEKTIKEFEKTKNKYPDLSCVIDIAEGREVYFVDEYMHIRKYPDDMKDFDKKLRAVSWVAVWDNFKSQRRMVLEAHQYSDHSGSSYPYIACKTMDDAIKKQKELAIAWLSKEEGKWPDIKVKALQVLEAIAPDEPIFAEKTQELAKYKKTSAEARLQKLNEDRAKIIQEMEGLNHVISK
jgi:chaperonin cofactor prefoldin